MARHEDSDEDPYAAVGTPFEVLETAEDVQKAKVRKEKEQYVLDEQGRRRFHGAFTGGFSAGYYNTVGSKEGWTPATFRSSRGTKSEFSGQKPEDFMDDEDLGAHGIAPREVATRANFTQKGPGGLKRTHPLNESRPNVIPGEAPLQNLVVPAKLSVGARLLRSMGWREGQGVGPRMQRSSEAAEGRKMYGCNLPQSSTDPSGPPSSEYLPEGVRGFLFAPQDVCVRQFEGKDDLHGIGYRGMEERGVLTGRETKRAVYGMSGEAFGVGALEDDDADDNVYGVESMTSYDVTLAGDGDMEMERKFGWTGGVEDSWSLASFTKATKPPPTSKVFHAPEVPRDFIPIHRFSILNVKSDQDQPVKPVTAGERNQLLADKPGSVFSLLSAADRDRLRRVTEQAPPTSVGTPPQPLSNTPSQLHHVRPHPLAPPTSSYVTPPGIIQPHSLLTPPQAAQQTAASLGDTAVESIKPFAHNPLKQARYEAFQSGRKFYSDPESIGMTEWERQREREQFSRTSRVYQPLSVSLNTRFTREGSEGDKKKSESPEPDSVQAARANMFGILTRQVLKWHPHPVLCKRFNVPDPYPNEGLVGTVTEQNKQSSATKHIQFLPNTRTDTASNDSSMASTNVPNSTQLQARDVAAVVETGAVKRGDAAANTDTPAPGTTTMEGETRPEGASTADEVKEEERPPMDLFKAIFAESSSSESSDSETETQPEKSNLSLEATTAASSGNQEAPLHETKQRKTRWQDLSVLTNNPLPLVSATDMHKVDSNTTKDSAETLSGIAAVDRGAAANGDRHVETTASLEKTPKEVFGPILPPGYDDNTTSGEVNLDPRLLREGGGERDRGRKERGEHGGRHHKHKHKSPKNNKRKKIRDNEEGVSHRSREKKKSRHKH